MSQVIKRSKSDHADHGFSAKPNPVEYTPPNPQGLNANGEQEITRLQKYEIALTKRDNIHAKRKQELFLIGLGFSKQAYDVYEAYRADMRSEHDIYRKPPKSDQWTHNSLWNYNADTTQGEQYKSNRLCYKSNSWLKKIGFFELRAAIRLFRNDVSQKWTNGMMFLPDAQSRHAKGIKTPCKLIKMTGLLNMDTGEYLVVTAYAIKRQYFISHEIKLWGFELEFKPKTIKTGERMKSRIEDAFTKCHVSRHGIFSYQKALYDQNYDAKPKRSIAKAKAKMSQITEFDFEGFLLNNAKPTQAQIKPAKPLNFSLWKHAKSDQIFMEQFRTRVND